MEGDNEVENDRNDSHNTTLVERINSDLPITRAPGPISFPQLPAEIRIKIFKDVIRGPLIHFAMMRKVLSMNGAGWSIKLGVKMKSRDTSGFRMMQYFKAYRADSQKAVKDMRGSRRIGFCQFKAGFSQTLDMVCFEFERTAPALRQFRYFSQELQFLTNDRPNYPLLQHQLKRYRRVAVAWNVGQLPNAGNPSACHIFPCFAHIIGNPHGVQNPYPHGNHLNWRMCPTELAAFFDCFTFLDAAYIIVVPDLKSFNSERTSIDEYVQIFRSMTPAERLSGGFEVFYDAKNTYIELHPSLLARNPNQFALAEHMLFPLIQQTKDSLQVTGSSTVSGFPIQYNLSLARRQNLAIKIMVPAGPKEKF